MNRGKILILLMVAAGLGAGALGVWYRHHQMNQVIEALTPRAAELLAYAPEVELARLEVTEGAIQPITSSDHYEIEIQGSSYRVHDRQSLNDSPAFAKLRKALVQNAAYDWSAPPPSEFLWPYLLTFRRGSEEVQFLFDPVNCRIALANSPQVLSISPVEPGLKKLMNEIAPREEK